MLISKFDLYKTEWLDLVFDDRNKSYGAYELRQHYPRTMVRAMVITFLTIGSAALIAGTLIKPVAATVYKIVPTVLPMKNYVYPPVVKPPQPISHVRHTVSPPATPVAPKVFVPLVASSNPTTIEPPKMSDLKGDITSTATPPAIPGDGIKEGKPNEGFKESTSTEVYSPAGLERMPEPYGGAGAWNKFLQKNLKYPDMAADQHASGAVWVSFIVEADGKLSNIKVLRGAGYGMDEEAIRVLKAAPAWKPGIQNGQPVRVSYNIPIRFILGDDSN
jgi:protein TonB